MVEAFVEFYKKLFTSTDQKQIVLPARVNRGKKLIEGHLRSLQVAFTKEDVKRIIFSIPDDKAPGSDGFNNSYFYKHYWEVIWENICEAVLEIFKTCKLLKAVNVNTLTLILKLKCLENVTEFRHIVCCNVQYKCITKLLSEILNQVLPDIVSASQGAFITGRNILHNVMICQDLFRCYKRKKTRAVAR